jgi:hypothetical protein
MTDQETRMTEHRDNAATDDQHVEIIDHGHPLAAAEVSTPTKPHGTAHVAFHAESGHLPVGTRTHLVDAVLDLPNVQLSDHLMASAPIGDTESMARLRVRTTDMRTHAAGCTAIIDAELIAPCDCPPLDPS